MNGCEKCCGNCGGCGELILTVGEIEMLRKLAQIPFLPVARRADSPEPIYLEDSDHSPGEYSLILQCLEKRGLISVDFDKPLKGSRQEAYASYPIQGSFALTQSGQNVLEQLELHGIWEEESN